MASSQPAVVNPALLVWARETAGLEIQAAAKRLGVAADKLRRVEAGDGRLTVKQLVKAADVYKRPFTAFYLAAPPMEQALPAHDYRRLGRGGPIPLTTNLRFALRRAKVQREDAIALASEIGAMPAEFSLRVSTGSEVADVAGAMRTWLGIGDDEQLSWMDVRHALHVWKSRVEAHDVLVMEVSKVRLDEMRGFSVWAERFPTVVLNGGDSPAGKIFTLLHELTHLALNQGGLCDVTEDVTAATDEGRIEVFCNSVAGQALVPDRLLWRVLPSNIDPDRWTKEILIPAARRLSTSTEVVLRRLLAVGRTSADYYEVFREQLKLDYESRSVQKKEQSGGPSYYVLRHRNLGAAFVRLALEAYAQNKISLSALSDYLGVKADRVGTFVDETPRGASA